MDKPEKIIVVRKSKPNEQVAREILKAVTAKPHEHQVPVLAEKLGVDESQIVHVLHNYSPNDQGGVERRPDGQGGGWLSEEVAAQYRSSTEDPEHIGYRWPDSQLRDVMFDENNDEHWERMGWKRPTQEDGK